MYFQKQCPVIYRTLKNSIICKFLTEPIVPIFQSE